MIDVRLLPALAALPLTACILSACSSECGSRIYPDYPELSATEAARYGSLEDNDPPGGAADIRPGSGAIAQPGRELHVRVSAFDREDRHLGDAELEYLFPAFDKRKHGSLAWGIDSGQVPQYFSGLVSGMRVGGRREFMLPSIGGYGGQEPRVFRTRDGQHPVLEVPRDEVRMQVELLAVCKPEFCIETTWSIPSARMRRLTESGCR